MGWKNGWKSPFIHPRWWFELENMRKSNWIMKPQTFGVETNSLFETYHLAEKYIHENYPPEKDHMGPTVHEKFGKSLDSKGAGW